jgi:tryptophanyl-tRNA synthetase
MIAEDKIEVLITLLHNQIAKDMMNSEFNKKYIFFIPSNLYTKEKKLEGLLNDMNNEYVKNHVYIANNIEQVSNYKEIIQKLYKKGYKFVTNINKEDSIKKGDVKLLYLSDYLFTNNENINLPLELMNNVIKENIENKISDSRGN